MQKIADILAGGGCRHHAEPRLEVHGHIHTPCGKREGDKASDGEGAIDDERLDCIGREWMETLARLVHFCEVRNASRSPALSPHCRSKTSLLRDTRFALSILPASIP